VILPAENKTNVEEDLTPEQLENVQIHYVKSIPEVLQFALPKSAPKAASPKSVKVEPERVMSAQPVG
jgi:ATP-dependent Lon protease